MTMTRNPLHRSERAGLRRGAAKEFRVLVYERCGCPRRIVGAVTEPDAMRRLLAALGLAVEPPPTRPFTA